ncbi:unnamed protein product, partial [Ilex paraguariensis]
MSKQEDVIATEPSISIVTEPSIWVSKTLAETLAQKNPRSRSPSPLNPSQTYIAIWVMLGLCSFRTLPLSLFAQFIDPTMVHLQNDLSYKSHLTIFISDFVVDSKFGEKKVKFGLGIGDSNSR